MIHCPKCNTANDSGSSFCIDCGAPLVEQKSADTIGGLETLPPQGVRHGGSPVESPVIELEPGAMFAGRYRIERKIDQGGMGVVYLAVETLAGQDRAVALKLIRADRLADRKAVDRLVSEGALTQNIRHPNVVAVYNVGEADGQAFVAMEYVEGVSLREWHRRQLSAKDEIPLEISAAIIGSILDGLDAAHRLAIVHRDLKPENVVLTGTPQGGTAPLKILDFGIASAPGKLESGTGTGLGTPRYMAPEQITNPATAGPPADLYSLSIIFYELLMDVLPQGHWQPPSGGRGDVPVAIDKLIEKGLSNRPASRQQSVEEYRQELTAALGTRSGSEGEGKKGLLPVPDFETVNEGVEAYRNSWASFLSGKRGKWTIGLAAAVGAVIGISNLEQDGTADDGYDFSEESGDVGPPDGEEDISESDAEIVGPEERTIEPPEPSVSSPFLILSGAWDDGQGTKYRVNVNSDGSYEANGQSVGVGEIRFNGSIPGGQYRGSAAGASFSGQTSWNGDCHIPYQTYRSDGLLIASGQFHVDHAPGAPCPARFAR